MPPLTVADAMLRHPTVHPGGLSVGEARAAFAASPKTHLLLLVTDGVLISALTRSDLEAPEAEACAPAWRLGSLADRVVAPGAALGPVRDHMIARGRRRLAVVGPSMRLLGLLCLKRARTGFCTDDGVARMRRERGVPDARPVVWSSGA